METDQELLINILYKYKIDLNLSFDIKKMND